jgi:hypothetical protein
VFSVTGGGCDSGADVAADAALVIEAPVAVEIPLVAVLGEAVGAAVG